MSNYKKINVGNEGRTELHEALSLTGAEVSINTFLAGASVPFAGDWLKISPAAKRQFFAASDSSITYICIQVKENSLDGFTVNDAIIY